MACFGVLKNIMRLTKLITAYSIGKIKRLLLHAKLYINQRSELRRVAFTFLARYPILAVRIKRAMIATYSGQSTYAPVSTKLVNLTPRARRIYADLKAARTKT